MPIGWRRAGQRQQVRLPTPVQLARGAGAGLFAQRGVQPRLDEALPEAHQRVRVQADFLGHDGVWLARIGAQQGAGAFVPTHACRALAGQRLQLLSLLRCEFDDVLLVHRTVLRRSVTLHNPNHHL